MIYTLPKWTKWIWHKGQMICKAKLLVLVPFLFFLSNILLLLLSATFFFL